MKKVYALTPQQLHDAIQNTIRVFNDYRLDKKIGANNAYKVYGSGHFYLYQLFTTPEGTQLKITCGKLVGKITEEQAIAQVQQFSSRIDQIVNKQIILTPDVANRDVYKSGQGGLALLSLIKLAVAVIAIIIALMALMH